MTYTRFAAMIATSTLVMLVLMYLNTYAFEHIFYSETRVYMAILMGATMAFVMMGFMRSMYPSRMVNLAIFAGSIAVFALALWLVRSQVTVQGASFMRAMIPHHSIAVMTSKRSELEDARVEKLAGEIWRAQQKEIAEMRALIADLEAGNVVTEIYEDPPAQVGSVGDALNNTLRAGLDPAPLPRGEAGPALPEGDVCTFRRTREAEPILWAGADGEGAVMKLNGVIVPLQGAGEGTFGAEGLTMT
ncbi:DUF305 domain-containing protein, partial [Cribrihabitans sp. XS_ASV171]